MSPPFTSHSHTHALQFKLYVKHTCITLITTTVCMFKAKSALVHTLMQTHVLEKTPWNHEENSRKKQHCSSESTQEEGGWRRLAKAGQRFSAPTSTVTRATHHLLLRSWGLFAPCSTNLLLCRFKSTQSATKTFSLGLGCLSEEPSHKQSCCRCCRDVEVLFCLAFKMA